MIVIGDVHGEFDSLMKLLDILPQTDNLCFVGDLIDRGPKSKDVVDFVFKNDHSCVMGNHEDLATGNDWSTWAINGALQTLKSYSPEKSDYDVFREHEHFDWLCNLPLFCEWTRDDGQKFIISHSFAYNGMETMTDEILWAREPLYVALSKDFNEDDDEIVNKPLSPFFDEKFDDGFINVFGHTPLKNTSHRHILNRHWLIDGGCTYGGKLTAIDLQTEEIYFVDKV